jgi:hypothetical protein
LRLYNNRMQYLADRRLCESFKVVDQNSKCLNAMLFREMHYVPEYYQCQKQFCEENALMWPMENRLCDKEVILYRGQNNVKDGKVIRDNQQPFLLPYCKENKFRNSIVSDDKKYCSRTHQLFNNVTKRGC